MSNVPQAAVAAHNEPELADDLLEGAPAIARFVFGRDDPKTCRKLYHLASRTDRNELAIFKLGNKLHARKSTIKQKIAEKEAKRST